MSARCKTVTETPVGLTHHVLIGNTGVGATLRCIAECDRHIKDVFVAGSQLTRHLAGAQRSSQHEQPRLAQSTRAR